MATIGIYDSGIGGLTTLAAILDKFVGNDIYYFADNLNLPYGNKSLTLLKCIVQSGISKLKNHCDIPIIACNTASSIAQDDDSIHLLPPQNSLSGEDCLLLATHNTKLHFEALKAAKECNFVSANTNELAQMIEIQASLTFRRKLDMSALLSYLKVRLANAKNVRKIVLGCSHYPFVKPQLKALFGEVEFADGNAEILRLLSKQITPNPLYFSSIKFEFSAERQEQKYQKILSALINDNYLI